MLIAAVNPGLDWLDTVQIYVKGRGNAKVYVWKENKWVRVSEYQDSASDYVERLCYNNTEMERICEYNIHTLVKPIDMVLIKLFPETNSTL